MANRTEITKLVAVLASAARVKLDEPLLEAYALVLADVDPRTLKDAVLAAVKAPSPFLRKPGELLADCEKLRTRNTMRAVAAWEDYLHFGRGNPLTLAIARSIDAQPHTEAFYVDGRRYFVIKYTQALRQHNGDLAAAIEHSQQLALEDRQ